MITMRSETRLQHNRCQGTKSKVSTSIVGYVAMTDQAIQSKTRGSELWTQDDELFSLKEERHAKQLN
jgi:hypothetical protein